MKAKTIDEKANRTECLNQGHLHMAFFGEGGVGGRGEGHESLKNCT